MKVQLLAGFGTLVAASAASAALTGASVTSMGDIGGGVDTWRVYIEFDNPADNLLAISGNAAVAALQFQSLDGDALVNEVPGLNGTRFEDTPFPTAAAYDSWVTLGETGASDTSFSPSFLGDVSGALSVINGTSFSQADNGGYFDQNPGTPDGSGGSALIAQFTVANFTYSGTIDYTLGGAGSEQGTFSVTTVPVPAPGAMALLGLAGLAARRRRR